MRAGCGLEKGAEIYIYINMYQIFSFRKIQTVCHGHWTLLYYYIRSHRLHLIQLHSSLVRVLLYLNPWLYTKSHNALQKQEHPDSLCSLTGNLDFFISSQLEKKMVDEINFSSLHLDIRVAWYRCSSWRYFFYNIIVYIFHIYT